MILAIILAVEAFVIGLIIGYAEGYTRAKKYALKIIEEEMADFVQTFNDLIDDVYQHTGIELPKIPARKEK